MGLAAADEDRSATIAVTSGTAALLLAELLAGAGNVRALTRAAGEPTTVGELPRHHAMEDVGARLDTEHGVVELDIPARLGVEGLNLDLHRLAFLILGRVRRSAVRVRGLIVEFATSVLLRRDRLNFGVTGQCGDLMDRGVFDEARGGHFGGDFLGVL